METQQVPTPVVNQKNNVPAGVWIVAVFFFLNALTAPFTILLFLFSPSDGSVPLRFTIICYYFLSMIFYLVAGINLLRLKNWARILSILLLIASVIFTSLLSIQSSYSASNTTGLAEQAAFYFILDVAVTWYLIRAKNSFN
jgi:hypothetical protein